jgi:glucokinase
MNKRVKSMKTILAADIGATNSRFGHFVLDQRGTLSKKGTIWFETKRSSSFVQLLNRLDKENFSLTPQQADMVVIAVAGPVERKTFSSPPFISWTIDITNAFEDCGIRRCFLINDFVAQAYACCSPVATSKTVILNGKADSGAALVTLGAGSNLGKAVLVPDGHGGFTALPSEGGHTNMPLVSDQELEYSQFVCASTKEPYLTQNTVVSGKGLSFIHHFLTGEQLDPETIGETVNANDETVRWMATFYARVCRNFALDCLAMGGVYITGGVAAKLPLLIKHPSFEKEFQNSKTMEHILIKIPVFLMTDEENGLWGAACFGKLQLF